MTKDENMMEEQQTSISRGVKKIHDQVNKREMRMKHRFYGGERSTKSIPEEKVNKEHKPWWTCELRKLKTVVNRARRQYQNAKQSESDFTKIFQEYRAIHQNYYRRMRFIKQKYMREFLPFHNTHEPLNAASQHEAGEHEDKKELRSICDEDDNTIDLTEEITVLNTNVCDENIENKTSEHKELKDSEKMVLDTAFEQKGGEHRDEKEKTTGSLLNTNVADDNVDKNSSEHQELRNSEKMVQVTPTETSVAQQKVSKTVRQVETTNNVPINLEKYTREGFEIWTQYRWVNPPEI